MRTTGLRQISRVTALCTVSPRSAYVSGQVIRVSRAANSKILDWTSNLWRGQERLQSPEVL